MIADGKGAHACTTPQYCYNEWLARENEADALGANKVAPDSVIEGCIIHPDGIIAIQARQPFIRKLPFNRMHVLSFS